MDMRRFLLMLLFVFGVISITHSAPGKLTPKKPAVVRVDSSRVQQRYFDNKKISGYSKDPELRYDKNDLEGESLWDQFWRAFWRWVNRHLFASKQTTDLVYYIIIGIGVCLATYILMRVSGISTSSLLRGKARAVPLHYSESTEDIHLYDFDSEIEKAVAAGNYRLAVRLYYLYTLKQLHDAHLINWKIEKTNSAYLGEIPDGERRQLFGLLTRRFEYIWYGNFYIDTNAFNELSAQFKQFKKAIK